MKRFCDDRIIFAAGRTWAVRAENGGILLFIYSIFWSCSELKPKREHFWFYDGVQVTNILGK